MHMPIGVPRGGVQGATVRRDLRGVLLFFDPHERAGQNDQPVPGLHEPCPLRDPAGGAHDLAAGASYCCTYFGAAGS